MKKIKILIAIAVIGLPALAQAQLVQTQHFAFVPNASQVLTFNRVSLPAPSITSILVEFTLHRQGGSLSVDNDSASSGNVTFTLNVQGSLTSSNPLIDPGFSTGWTTLNNSQSTMQTLGPTTGDPTNQYNATFSSDFYQFFPTPATTSVSQYLSHFAFPAYSGVGTYTITVTGNQLTNASGLGGLQQVITTANASGSVTVTVIPEPTSAALAIGAAGLLGFLRWRRKRLVA